MLTILLTAFTSLSPCEPKLSFVSAPERSGVVARGYVVTPAPKRKQRTCQPCRALKRRFVLLMTYVRPRRRMTRQSRWRGFGAFTEFRMLMARRLLGAFPFRG